MKQKKINIKQKITLLFTIFTISLISSKNISATITIPQEGEVIYGEAISKTLSRLEGQSILSNANFGKIITNSSYYKPSNQTELITFLDRAFSEKESYYLLELDKNVFPVEYATGQFEINSKNRDSVHMLSNLQWSYYPEKNSNSFKIAIVPAYFESEGRLISRDLFVNELADEINERYTTDFEKVYALYSYIIRHTTYDYGTPIQNDSYADNVEAAFASTLILKNRAVCQGYAELFSLVADKLGIDNHVAIGTIFSNTTGGNYLHAWNKVKIDGEWYNLDATWGDYNFYLDGIEITHGLNKRISYFLFSDEVAKLSRTFDSKTLPPATSKKYDIFHEITGEYGLDSGLYKDKIVFGGANGIEIYYHEDLRKHKTIRANPNTYSVINGIIYYQTWTNNNVIYYYDIENDTSNILVEGYTLLGSDENGVHIKSNSNKSTSIINFVKKDGFDTLIFKIGVAKHTDKIYKNVNEFVEINKNNHVFEQYSKASNTTRKKNLLDSNLKLNDLGFNLHKSSFVFENISFDEYKNTEISLFNNTKGIQMPLQKRYLGNEDLEVYSKLKLKASDSYSLILKEEDKYLSDLNITISNFIDFKGIY